MSPESNDLRQLFSQQKEYLPAHLLVFFAEELQVSQIQNPCKDLEGLEQVHIMSEVPNCVCAANIEAGKRNALEI